MRLSDDGPSMKEGGFEMYHSITIGEKNTWDDWHLVPTSRPVFNPPSLKKKTLEVPGGDGLIDLSEAITGYPVYNNREGSVEFIVMNGYKAWHNAYSDIMDYVHGQSRKAILEDDREFFYDGRFTVNNWKSDKEYSKITLDYSLGPYKWTNLTSLDPWLWDPFDFETGVILPTTFKDIPVTTTNKVCTFDGKMFGRAPFCPAFLINTSGRSGMEIRFVNPKLKIDVTKRLPEGKTQLPELIFFGGTVTIYFRCLSGTGTVSVEFRRGRL